MYNNLDYDSRHASWHMIIDMPACNTSREYGNWSMQIHQSKWWNTEDWTDFALPDYTVDFGARTASLTLDGVFRAEPYMRSEHPMLSANDAVQGAIQVRFRGVLDAYHSDILDGNSASPAWLRTVGFGNNSLNIGDASNGGSHFRPALWCAFLTCLIAIITYT